MNSVYSLCARIGTRCSLTADGRGSPESGKETPRPVEIRKLDLLGECEAESVVTVKFLNTEKNEVFYVAQEYQTLTVLGLSLALRVSVTFSDPLPSRTRSLRESGPNLRLDTSSSRSRRSRLSSSLGRAPRGLRTEA